MGKLSPAGRVYRNTRKPMQITLTRRMKARQSVIGEISVNGRSWRTIENAAYIIPLGTWPIKLTWSPKFKKRLPLITCPHRKGIRIHPANFASELRGCIAVGMEVRSDGQEFALVDSRKAMAEFLQYASMIDFPELAESTITIRNEKGFTLNYFDEWKPRF